jgi:hypothetical protein
MVTEISEELAVSLFWLEEVGAFKTVLDTYQTTLYHTPEDRSFNFHRRGK